ncbi:MAG: hypothetical protein KC912_26600 [Proteobacteria bacterium]|nr:hypothetical protein [Pseudomonadota bacterium]
MTTLGDLITVFYDEYLALYGDEDLAAVAAASSVNKLIGSLTVDEIDEHEEEAAA